MLVQKSWHISVHCYCGLLHILSTELRSVIIRNYPLFLSTQIQKCLHYNYVLFFFLHIISPICAHQQNNNLPGWPICVNTCSVANRVWPFPLLSPYPAFCFMFGHDPSLVALCTGPSGRKLCAVRNKNELRKNCKNPRILCHLSLRHIWSSSSAVHTFPYIVPTIQADGRSPLC
jgi:hypothetical protein